jgi:hypothetical protein
MSWEATRRWLPAFALSIAFVACAPESVNVVVTDRRQPLSSDPEERAVQQVLIACYERLGVPAEPLAHGAVLFDRGGNLTKEESFELAGLCAAELERSGLTEANSAN